MWTSASQDHLVGFAQLTILSDQGHISELVVISHVSNGRLQRGGGICLILIFSLSFQEPAVATLPGSLGTGRVPQIGEDAVQLNTLLSQVPITRFIWPKYLLSLGT